MSADLLAQLAQAAEYLKTHKIETYKPYPFQLKFHAAGSEFQYRFLLAGQQIGKCNSFSSNIDTTEGPRKIGQIKEDFRVWAWDGEKKVETKALRPFEKGGLHECYRFVMSDGRWFESADKHRILTSEGWAWVSELLQEFSPSHRESNQGTSQKAHKTGVHHYNRTALDFQGGYPVDFRSHGVLPLFAASIGLASFPLQADVLRHNGHLYNSGVQGGIDNGILFGSSLRLSIRDVALRFFGRLAGFLTGVLHKHVLPKTQTRSVFRPLQVAVASVLRSVVSSVPLVQGAYSSSNLASVVSVEGERIVAVYPVGRHRVYDFTVPGYENYCTAGVVHHNSVSNLCETTYHLTGLYPEWWTGVRFKYAVDWWLGGQSTKKVRDNLQKKLLGDHEDPSSLGTGWIPRECIGKVTRMAGIPGSLDAVKVKHISGGWSNLQFKTYEQKVEEWMGETMDGISLDEEPGQDIFSQCVIRTLRKKGPILITATPEKGMTEVVRMFMQDKKPGTWYMHASMDDAPHYTSEGIDLALSVIPAHEREMRRKGLPIFGSGLVFMASDEQIRCEPFPIPSHYHRIGAIDFGYDHPFASVHCAWDKENDVFYVYDLYTEKGVIPLIHAAALNRHESWIPIAWPHDGLNTEKGSGTPLAQIYRDNGVNLMIDKFTNPPAEDQKEGEGGNKIWPGLIEMNQSMMTGRFKVFSNLSAWFIEKASYHCDKNGDLVMRGEDIMSATRYAYMSRRHAITKPVIREYQHAQNNYWMT